MGEILNDICELIVDCEHKTAPTQSEGYPSIRTPNIGRGEFLLDGVNRVSEDTYNAWTRRAIPKEKDIILAREAPIGNAAIIPKNLKVCLGQRTVLIRPNKKKVFPEYLLYLLIGDEIQNRILSISSGATVPHLNMEDIRNLNLPSLPKYSSQEKISTILYNYYKLIENNTRRIQVLEEMAQRIYKEWFVDFKYPGYENDKLVESELGMIPEGWEIKSIKEVANKVVLGGTPARKNVDFWDNGTIPWIKSGKLNDLRVLEGTEYITDLGLSSSATKLMPKRTVLIAITGAIIISLSEIELCANQSVIGIYDSSKLSQEYIYLNQKANIQQYISKMSGSAQQHINKDIVQHASILVPENDVRIKFDELIRPIFNNIANLLFKNQNLRQTRDLLLPKLISGKIDVSDLDIETSILYD